MRDLFILGETISSVLVGMARKTNGRAVITVHGVEFLRPQAACHVISVNVNLPSATAVSPIPVNKFNTSG